MKAQWKDYKYGSWLVLVFGRVHAKIVSLGETLPAGERFGIIIEPHEAFEFIGTLDAAKRLAEANLRDVLTESLAKL